MSFMKVVSKLTVGGTDGGMEEWRNKQTDEWMDEWTDNGMTDMYECLLINPQKNCPQKHCPKNIAFMKKISILITKVPAQTKKHQHELLSFVF